MARAVFLDRDGVLNKNVFNPATGEYESPRGPEDFCLVDGVIESLRKLQDAGFLLFLVSNQPNYAKGKNTLEQLDAIHNQLDRSLTAGGIHFSRYFYCFHHPHGTVESHSGPCECRKPSPHFLHLAAREYELSLAESWMIGDRPTDIECGHAAGVRTIRILDGARTTRSHDDPLATFEADDLRHAVLLLLGAA